MLRGHVRKQLTDRDHDGGAIAFTEVFDGVLQQKTITLTTLEMLLLLFEPQGRRPNDFGVLLE